MALVRAGIGELIYALQQTEENTATGLAHRLSEQLLLDLVFVWLCQQRGLLAADTLSSLATAEQTCQTLGRLATAVAPDLVTDLPGENDWPRLLSSADPVIRELAGALAGLSDEPMELPFDFLGQIHETCIGLAPAGSATPRFRWRGRRKADGVYYTPVQVADRLLDLVWHHREGLPGRIRLVDPACGGGALLLAAAAHLLRAAGTDGDHRFTSTDSRQCASLDVLRWSTFGVDLDPLAICATRRALLLLAWQAESCVRTSERQAYLSAAAAIIRQNIRCGNAIIGADFLDGQHSDQPTIEQVRPFDWKTAFPDVLRGGRPGFDVVLGNPPWGQKALSEHKRVKQYVRQRYHTVDSIYDLFRPFVEQGLNLLGPAGVFAMVLPDILLLKDYESTRRLLLDNLTISEIDWWPAPFPGALIDAITLVGTKQRAPATHGVAVTVHQPGQLSHVIPQVAFAEQPRATFNLYLTPARRQQLDQLRACPRLGDFFEIHEGVHSGNIRADLFVSRRLDATCRELIFGRDEVRPYRLEWHGRYLRLGMLPERGSTGRYANAGRREWHEREKVLVRRTGDRVIAAVDRYQRHASNNLFLIFPKTACALDLDGLCALLNSRLITWYFRVIEPRTGRPFSELKIKHLCDFPLPPAAVDPVAAGPLNRLGWCRAKLAQRDSSVAHLPQSQKSAVMSSVAPAGGHSKARKVSVAADIDIAIDRLVESLFPLTTPIEEILTSV